MDRKLIKIIRNYRYIIIHFGNHKEYKLIFINNNNKEIYI